MYRDIRQPVVKKGKRHLLTSVWGAICVLGNWIERPKESGLSSKHVSDTQHFQLEKYLDALIVKPKYMLFQLNKLEQPNIWTGLNYNAHKVYKLHKQLFTNFLEIKKNLLYLTNKTVHERIQDDSEHKCVTPT